MKLFISCNVLLLVCVLTATALDCDGSRRKRSSEMGTCNVTTVDGGFELIEYGCDKVCCGRQLTDRHVGSKCCGNELNGAAYNEKTQLCCSWEETDQHAVHEKLNMGEFCCGTELFEQQLYSDGKSCCKGWKTFPTIFNQRTDMCCEGIVSFVGDTSYGSCCGKNGYDRRNASCPCHRGPALIDISREDAACCRKQNDQNVFAPYDTKTQQCCNGEVYDPEAQMCCGNVVGDSNIMTCCNDLLTMKDVGAGEGLLGCCELADGTKTTFDPSVSICCDGQVQELPLGEAAICCGNSVYLVTDHGDQCCEATDGSSSVPYDSTVNVCCNGTTGGVDFEWASCCGNLAYDAFTHTCCGLNVLENPEVPSLIEGEVEISHFTRCCGNHADQSTLKPFDYFQSLCCDENIIDLGYDRLAVSQCCGGHTIDTNLEVCCGGNHSIEATYGANTGCCGGIAHDTTTSICCNGSPRSFDGVDESTAVCCGDGCIDGSLYYCCKGKMYGKSDITPEQLNRLSCEFDGEAGGVDIEGPPAVGPVDMVAGPVIEAHDNGGIDIDGIDIGAEDIPVIKAAGGMGMGMGLHPTKK